MDTPPKLSFKCAMDKLLLSRLGIHACSDGHLGGIPFHGQGIGQVGVIYTTLTDILVKAMEIEAETINSRRCMSNGHIFIADIHLDGVY